MQPNIRKGVKADLNRVLELITELAIYEKEPDAVEITVDDLVQNGFGKNPLFGLFVAEINNQIEGIALYYFKYSTWKGRCLYLEDIVVSENLRNHGLGKLLFDQVVKVAAIEKCKRMEWQVLKWNDPAIQFYTKKYQASLDGEWFNGRLNEGQIATIGNSVSPI